VLSGEKDRERRRRPSHRAREGPAACATPCTRSDQCHRLGGDQLVGTDVARVLGVASHSVLYELSSALLGGDAARSLSIVADLANQGYDIAHVARDMLSLLRNWWSPRSSKSPTPCSIYPTKKRAT